MIKKFEKEKAYEENPNWENMISRKKPLYSRNNNLRSEFQRDYNRILNCNAYKRMKHKTQVFFNPTSDHVCTRGEHVNLVESISYTIAESLGLNTELTKAISVGHDIGHTPFGHAGGNILSEISKRDIGRSFWHEQNGLEMVEKIELLEDLDMNMENLNLTYAVRDGIISHCGEIDENSIKPRTEFIDLNDYKYPNQFAPYTWEGCVVKISDKISYILRDISDAIKLNIIEEADLKELHKKLKIPQKQVINNTHIVNDLIYDIYSNSTPEKGLTFSSESLNLLNTIKQFNYEKIYFDERHKESCKFFKLVITEIYEILKQAYDGENTLNQLKKLHKFYPVLIDSFIEWISRYWNLTDHKNSRYKNDIIFDINNEKDYYQAIIYYISGMTDNFAINTYMEAIRF
jgi:dGTPase